MEILSNFKLLNTPWLLSKDQLAEMERLYINLESGEYPPFNDKALVLGGTITNYLLDGGGLNRKKAVAVVKISGVLQENLSFWAWIFGGTSTKLLDTQIARLVADDDVDAIILDVCSPGGEVGGTFEVANTIFEAREKKPIYAVIGSCGCSGAYLIASAANKIFISSPSSVVGSIGVAMSHRDISEFEKKKGIKTTEVTAGKFKRIVSSYKPLDDEALNELQRQVNAIYKPFVSSVAKFRGKDQDFVLENMADGKIFIGSDAIENSLVDGTATLRKTIDDIILELNSNNFLGSSAKMDLAELKEKHPALYAQVVNETTASVEKQATVKMEEREKALEEKASEAAKLENDRIKAIEDLTPEGLETFVAGFKYDSTVSVADASARILKELKDNRPSLETIKNQSSDPVNVSGNNDDAKRKVSAQNIAYGMRGDRRVFNQ
jgi:signal peptide peptidase SppA